MDSGNMRHAMRTRVREKHSDSKRSRGGNFMTYKKSLPAILGHVFAGLALPLAVGIVHAADLGTIQVESTTIDDRFEAKRSEASNIAVISGERVDTSRAENIQQLLQSVPGITTEFDSQDHLKIHMRGVENQRYYGEKPGVAIVIDGVPVFERTGKVNIDLDNIESIKVIKGGASYLFGDDALAGAVIITTKRGAKNAGFRVSADRGSDGYYKGLFRAGYANDLFNTHLQVSRRASDGYWFQSDYTADYVNGKLQYYLDDRSDITFGFERAERAKDSHGSVEGATQARLDPRSVEGRDYARKFDVSLGKYFATYARDFGETSNLLVNVYQFADDTSFVSAPQNFDVDGNRVTDVDAYTNGNDYHQVQRGIKSEWRSGGERFAWMAGLDLRANTYENKTRYLVDHKTSPSPFAPVRRAGTVTQDNTTDENVQALYGELKFSLAQPLTVTLNGRYDKIELDYKDKLNDLTLGKTFSVSSWRLGGNYALSDYNDLYANISTGFRAPTVEQLFAGDISPTGDTASNPNLKPEQAINKEIGLRSKTELFGIPWDLDLAIFRIDRDDYIMASVGQYGGVPAGEQQQFQNIGGMRSQGLELALRSDPSRKWWTSIAYTYLDAKFTDYKNFNLLLGNRYGGYFDSTTGGNADGICDPGEYDPANSYCIERRDNTGNVVPRVPRHHLNVALNYRATPRWTLTGEMDAISSYYADEVNLVNIGGHATFNLMTQYDLKFGNNQTWSFFARVDNLFDRRFYNTARGNYDSASIGTGGVPDGRLTDEDISIVVNPGRTFTLGIEAVF